MTLGAELLDLVDPGEELGVAAAMRVGSKRMEHPLFVIVANWPDDWITTLTFKLAGGSNQQIRLQGPAERRQGGAREIC